MRHGFKLAAVCTAVLATSFIMQPVWADDDEWWERGKRGEDHESHERFRGERKPVTGVRLNNPLYEKECAACHMAYQPGFLTQQAWMLIMEQLDDHFGDDASLDRKTRQAIMQYLSRHSESLSSGMGEHPVKLRITETRFFMREHHEIPDRMVKGNKQVRSFSNCNACHTQATSGDYSEHGVRIPGVGRWED